MICPWARAKTLIFNLLTYMACLEFHMGPQWCMVGHHGSVRVQAMADWDSMAQLALQNWAMGL